MTDAFQLMTLIISPDLDFSATNDLSTPITGASDPENTNIKDFVKAYKNMLAAMNDQHQIQQQVRDLQQKHSLHMPDATSPTE